MDAGLITLPIEHLREVAFGDAGSVTDNPKDDVAGGR